MKGAQEQDQSENQSPDEKRGLDPLDIVDMEGKQRELINWLSRQRSATRSDIQEALRISEEDLDVMVDLLAESDQIQVTQQDGKLFYSCSFKGRASRRLRGFPDDLWKQAGLDEE